MKVQLKKEGKYEKQMWKIAKKKKTFALGELVNEYCKKHNEENKVKIRMSTVGLIRKWLAQGKIKYIGEQATNSPIPQKLYWVVQ